ncbi:hypothetical protein [Conexibacter sp. DBS9H8]|uniref:hypothetical protein n=1 Tax=Conexibacter sp. DBS9H8 TaxID=2937801 RepID=UPI00200CC4D3|nr:hypothetical protein [Conexibacter sp. DBS9H8]
MPHSVQRLGVAAMLTAAVFCVTLIPRPASAQADLCGIPVIGVACSIGNGIGWFVSNGSTVAVNLGKGTVSVAGTVVGKVVSVGGSFACKTFTDGWVAKPCSWLANKIGSGAGSALSSSGSSGSGSGSGPPGSTTGQAAVPADSPQSYLRTSAIAAGAAFFSETIAHTISKGTSADLSAPWYHDLYQRVAIFAAGVAAFALLIALLEGAVAGDGALVAGALRAVPFAAVMTFAATALVMAALKIVDAASGDIAGPNLQEATHVLHIAAALFLALGAVAKASAMAAAHGGVLVKLGMIAKLAAFPAAMFAIFGVIAAVAVAAELLLREMAIYAAVLFLPLILAARIWPRLRHAGERLGRLLAAVILSKFVLVLTLAVIAGEILHGGLTGLAVGIGGLFVVALAPGLFYGLFVLAEHGFTRSATPLPAPLGAADRMAQVVGWHTAQVNEVRQVAPVVPPAQSPPPASAPPPAQPPAAAAASRISPDAEEVGSGDE